MNPLQRRLAALRRRFRLHALASGLFALIAVVVGASALVGLADFHSHLPSLFRALALVGILAGSFFVLYHFLIHPFLLRSDNLSLALRVEAAYPELNDALASTVQFLEQPEVGGSSALLRQKAIEKTIQQIQHLDFLRVLDRRPITYCLFAAIAALAVGGHFLYHHPSLSETALYRLADPFGTHTWTRIIVSDAPNRLALGMPFALKGKVEGIQPAQLKIELETLDLRTNRYERSPEIPVPLAKAGTFVKPLDVTAKRNRFRYRILGNDGQFPPQRGTWQTVDVLPPPSYAPLDGLPSPQIELRIPEYTDLPSPQKLSPGTQQLDLRVGTHVTFRAAVDRTLEEAWIEIRPQDSALKLASQVGFFGHASPLNLLAQTAASQAVSGQIPVAIDESRKILLAQFIPWAHGSYVVHLKDTDGLVRNYEADLRVHEDPVPLVRLVRPSISQSVLPNAALTFVVTADDDVFGLRSVFLEYRRKGPDGQFLDMEPQRLYLADPRALGSALRGVTGMMVPLERIIRISPRQMQVTRTWALKNQFKEGDVVVVQACADDFCNLFNLRQPGRSHEIELRIVGETEIANQLDDGIKQVQQEVARLQKMQQEAQDLLKDVKEGKADLKAFDQLIEAGQKQKEIKERVGQNTEEGLRKQLNQLQQMIKDNKLPNSEERDLLRSIDQELQRLQQEEFQQLDQALNEARKEMANPKKSSDPKKEEKQKDPLKDAKDLQKDVQKALQEMSQQLTPWKDLAEIKGKTRDLLNQQNQVAKETDTIKTDQDKQDQVNRQKQLQNQAHDLLQEMEKFKEALSQKGDREGANKLNQAKEAGKQLPGEMKAASENLNENKKNEAQQNQQKAAKTIEKMMAALDGKREDDLERLKKKQKGVKEAQKDLEKLEKKVRAAMKQQDDKQRAGELQRLAEQAREESRELQRLQEPQAAREMERVARQLEEAAKKAEAGEKNNAEEQNEILDRIENARNRLEEFEDELAREQVAKIADKLKGLKERQDAAVQRTKDLHAKVIQKKAWSRGLLQTLDADKQSQQGIGKETASLQEKIKEAAVFEHILQKAAQTMEKAAEVMSERKEAGKERQYPAGEGMDKEEVADENQRQEDIVRLQTQASQRLQRLLDAIADTPPQARKKNPPKMKEEGKNEEEPEGKGIQAQDGLPPMAQLKALKAEQVEVKERTKEFARRFPDLEKLAAERRQDAERELTELTDEQARLAQLFVRISSKTKGD